MDTSGTEVKMNTMQHDAKLTACEKANYYIQLMQSQLRPMNVNSQIRSVQSRSIDQ